MKRNEAGRFLKGYLDAALFTTDPELPGGCDYVECGRADELFPSLPDWFIAQSQKDCAKFELQNEELLSQAGDSRQNGSDFWYSRNGHGAGYFDRGYDDEIADPLQDAARAFGECYLMPEDFGLISKE